MREYQIRISTLCVHHYISAAYNKAFLFLLLVESTTTFFYESYLCIYIYTYSLSLFYLSSHNQISNSKRFILSSHHVCCFKLCDDNTHHCFNNPPAEAALALLPFHDMDGLWWSFQLMKLVILSSQESWNEAHSREGNQALLVRNHQNLFIFYFHIYFEFLSLPKFTRIVSLVMFSVVPFSI